MGEKKYKVVDEFNHVVAEGMTLEMALLFIKAYCQEYYNEQILLTLKEHERCRAVEPWEQEALAKMGGANEDTD